MVHLDKCLNPQEGKLFLISHVANVIALPQVWVCLFCEPKLHQEPSQLYLSSPTSTEPLHGSLTATIWIRSFYHSISVPRVSPLSLVTLATRIITISLLLFISLCLLYSWHDPHYWQRTFDKQFLCLSLPPQDAQSTGVQQDDSESVLMDDTSSQWSSAADTEEERRSALEKSMYVFLSERRRRHRSQLFLISSDNSHGSNVFMHPLNQRVTTQTELSWSFAADCQRGKI